MTSKQIIVSCVLTLALGLSIGGYLGVVFTQRTYQPILDQQVDVATIVNEDVEILNMCYEKMHKCCEVGK